jgi:serpin B
MRKNLIYFLVFCMFALTACSGKNNGGIKPKKTYDDVTDNEVFSVDQNTAFSLKMYDYWAKKNENKNIFFSPYSVSVALAMTYVGASGETAKQMKNALHFCCSGRKMASILGNLSSSVTDNPFAEKTSILLANSLWGQEDYPFLPEYVNFVRDTFSARVESVNFIKNTEKVRQEINEWVENKTENKIKDIIAKGVLSPLSQLVLVNAIYFKSPWLEKFDKNLTEKNAVFFGLEKDFKVDMMQNTATYKIAFLETLKILKMPYEGGNFAMYVILPNKKGGIKDIEPLLDVKHLDSWISDTSSKKVKVKFPRFRIENGYGLVAMFKKMGATDAFVPGEADFSGMDGTNYLYISEIIHKAFCDIDEQGTEAAAATAVVVVAFSAPLEPEEVYEFTADHPFIFLIRHEKTKTVLFVGRFMGPGL